jgi:hypothetical protein
MAELSIRGSEPGLGVHRDADGDVHLTVRADGVSIQLTVGRCHEDVLFLAASLRRLFTDVHDRILESWEDVPDEGDGYISVSGGRYHVTLDGARVGDYPSQDVAEIELARAMVTAGVFPNAWFITDHGNHVDITDSVCGWHHGGDDQMAALPGRQYQPGDRVRYTGIDWPCIVVEDWGTAGVEVHTAGDPSVGAHVTDRAELRPDTD